MRKLTLTLIAITILISSISSQTADSTKTSLHSGKMSILFAVGYDLRLGPIDGAMFSGKYHISNRLAVRLGGGIDFLKQEGTSTYDRYYTGPAKYERRNLTFNSYLVYYILKPGIINPYIGAGPLLTYSWYNEVDDTPERYYSYAEVENGYGAGILLGAEWFFMKSMSLFGEYNPYIQFTTYESEVYRLDISSSYTSRRDEGSTTRISSNVARLGLGVYF